jgi:hypothetical protein
MDELKKKKAADKKKVYDDEYALRIAYRNTFLNPQNKEGQKVLKDIFKNGYLFNDDLPLDRPDLIGKRNAAAKILNKLVCWDEPDKTMDEIIVALGKWPVLVKSNK